MKVERARCVKWFDHAELGNEKSLKDDEIETPTCMIPRPELITAELTTAEQPTSLKESDTTVAPEAGVKQDIPLGHEINLHT